MGAVNPALTSLKEIMPNEFELEESRVKRHYLNKNDSNTQSTSSMSCAMFFDYGRYCIQSRENAVLDMLWRSGYNPLDTDKQIILDAGCGTGQVMREFIRYGANPKNLHGIDLLQERIWVAKDNTPFVNLKCGNVAYMDYPENFFDVILCFTLFSSILNDKLREMTIERIKRFIKPNGRIVFYDMNETFNNDYLKGISKEQLTKWFGGTMSYRPIITKLKKGTDDFSGQGLLDIYKREFDNIDNQCFVAVIKDVKNA